MPIDTRRTDALESDANRKFTHEELQAFPFSHLAALILQPQETIRQLEARIAELENPLGPTLQGSSSKTQVVQAPDVGPIQGSHSELHRHHRPWYRKVWRSILPANPTARTYLPFILIVAATAALCIGLYFGAYIFALQSLVANPPAN